MFTSLLIGSGIGGFAGFMAFLITYEEYVKHYPKGNKPLRLSLEAAAFTFLVFLVLAVITGFVLTKTYMSQ